ncbi:MAG: BatD family protein [Coxiellaceae bacterium]|nr:BatD family protein [Coxiellaceae bacterium]
MIKKYFTVIAVAVVLVVTCCLQVAFAAASASVNRQQVTLGESFTLTINIPGDEQPDISVLRKNFNVFGQSSNRSIQIINGKASSSNQLVVTLMPKVTGSVTIPAIPVGDQSTQPIVIQVTKPDQQQLGGEKSPLFVKASLAAARGYVNAPVLYTVKLYFDNAVNLRSGDVIPGITEHVKLQRVDKRDRYSVALHGRLYQVIEQKYLLTPTEPGKLTINPTVFQGRVSSGRDDSFSFFSMDTGKPVTAHSNTVDYEVMPVPSSIATDQWFPASHASIQSDWTPNTDTLTTGVPVTRTITISAEGVTADAIPSLHLVTPQGVNAYPDKTQSSTAVNQTTMTAKKVFKVAYIPTEPGQLAFPALSLDWWDAKTGKKHALHIPKKIFSVKAAAVTRATVKPLAVVSAAVTQQSVPMRAEYSNTRWFYLTIVFAVLWLLTLLFWFVVSKYKKPVAIKHDAHDIADYTVQLKSVEKNLKAVCESNDPQQIQISLLVWARAYWDETNIRSLLAVKHKCDDHELQQALSRLERAVYRHTDYSDGVILWQLLHVMISNKKNSKKSRAKLKPFYKS